MQPRSASPVLVSLSLTVPIVGCALDPGLRGDDFGESEAGGETAASDDDSGGGTAGETTSASTGDTDEGEGPDEGPKIDVGPVDAGPGDCAGDPVETHSFIWVANSAEGTVSKIDTEQLVEEGRYWARPGGAGNPSRTSVGSAGDVAVANRFGGVTKIRALPMSCDPDKNGEPGLQTSTGKDDVLAWGDDDCIAWYAYGNYKSQRPVQWAPGVWNEELCVFEHEKVWSSGTTVDGDIEVLLHDGETGQVEETVPIPGIPLKWHGLYGGAADADGNFWGSQLGSEGWLVRVDRQDFTVETWPVPTDSYGITVDPAGRVFICAGSVARFDPQADPGQEWTVAPTGGSGGCMADTDGKLWQAGNAVRAVDTETLAVVDQVDVPAHGVSIDFHGYVWAVPANSPDAHRIDPDTKDVQTYSGLKGAYTYSDMTGFALAHAGGPEG